MSKVIYIKQDDDLMIGSSSTKETPIPSPEVQPTIPTPPVTEVPVPEVHIPDVPVTEVPVPAVPFDAEHHAITS